MKHKFPNQPIETDEVGTERFVKNRIVDWLLNAGPFDLNAVCIQGHINGWTDEEHAQFAQLTGYSVSGWGTLSYVSDEKYESVEAMDRSSDEQFAAGYAAGLAKARSLIEEEEDS